MEVTMKELLEAGAHFGHQTQRWDPRMAPFIYTQKGGIHIINLEKTVTEMKRAEKFIERVVKNGGTILFVGTKKQAEEAIEENAKKTGMPYVSKRWLGGMITNFQTVIKRTSYMKDLKKKLETNTDMIKKERVRAENELRKMKENLEGIKDMTDLPDAVFIVDIKKEKTAFSEAKKKGIPIIAIVDTNVNPEDIDYPIPSNDDAVRAVKIIIDFVGNAILKIPSKKSVSDAPDKGEKAKEGKTKTKIKKEDKSD